MRTVKASFGMKVMLKLAKVKLQEINGRFLVPNFREVERKVGRACRRYGIRFHG